MHAARVADLGFEDCSARTVAVPDSSFEGLHTFIQEHEVITAKAWTFYHFNITESDYQVIANVAGESSEDDRCELAVPGNANVMYGGAIACNVCNQSGKFKSRHFSDSSSPAIIETSLLIDAMHCVQSRVAS